MRVFPKSHKVGRSGIFVLLVVKKKINSAKSLPPKGNEPSNLRL